MQPQIRGGNGPASSQVCDEAAALQPKKRVAAFQAAGRALFDAAREKAEIVHGDGRFNGIRGHAATGTAAPFRPCFARPGDYDGDCDGNSFCPTNAPPYLVSC